MNYYDDDDTVEGGELEKMTFQIKDIVDEIDENIKIGFKEGGIKKCMQEELNEVKNHASQTIKKQEIYCHFK